jgi:AraC-like DNA-binding protein
MARPPPDLATRSPFVPPLLRYAAQRGLDAGALAARFGLGPLADVIDRDDTAILPSQIGELIEQIASALGEPALALALPAELPLRRYSLAEVAVKASANVRDALSRLAATAINAIHPHLEAALAGDAFVVRAPQHPRGLGRHIHELALAYARQLTGAVPVRVWFAHARPRDLAPVIRWAGTDDLELGAGDSGFTVANLDAPLPTSDARLLATVHDLAPEAARPRRFAAEVAALIRDRLPDPVTADDVAAVLHASARTLQRRLEAEHTSFTDVLDTTRAQLAREYLADPSLPLAEIAYRLGFADLATFSRAFKRWTGRPPGLFRRS